MSSKQHWNRVYSTIPTDKVGWYTPHLAISLSWIDELNLKPHDPIIDIGGGTSTLVDDLLRAGYQDITVLDLSIQAIRLAQERITATSSSVTWLQGDVIEAELPVKHYLVWHDRAVFHFLIDPEERERYKRALLNSLKPDGYFIIGVFSPEAPPQCSGLPVHRNTAESLSEFFGGDLELKEQRSELHVTPSGVEQAFVHCLFQRNMINHEHT